MEERTHDLVVIGGGPGGYVAAIRAAQAGLDTACIDENKQLGGTCLRVGCIPSKALLESSHQFHEVQHSLGQHGIQVGQVQLDLATMLNRKKQVVQTLSQGIAGLFKKNKVTRYQGRGRIAGPGQVQVEGEQPASIRARHIIIATGSKPASLKGVEVDHQRIGTSTEALSFDQAPEHLIVIGGGYIGMELGSVWLRLGAKVTVLEFLDRLLAGTDEQIAKEATKIFQKQGFDLRLKTRVTSARVEGDQCVVQLADGSKLTSDRVLMAVGRVPNTQNLGLDTVGVQLDGRGRIVVDHHWQTSVPGIYAIGDAIPGPMLAHKAEEEGIACVDAIVTGYGHVNYDAIPAVIFTDPEIAAVGKTEQQLKEENVPYRSGTFPFSANGRARTLGQPTGLVKILAHETTDRLLGVHILGPRAGDLIAEAAAAINFAASSEDLFRTSHAHPTLSEAIKEAAMAVAGKPIHM